MADLTNSSSASDTSNEVVAAGRYRRRGDVARGHRLTPRFTEGELAAIRAAAGAAGMTLTGFCASAAVASAVRWQSDPTVASAGEVRPSHGATGVEVEVLAELQRELFACRVVAVNRTGTNLNQAVAQLHSTGQPPVWLHHAVDRVVRAVDALDAVTSRIHRRLS